MTETLERYKLEIVNNHGDRYIRCEPAPDGSWVMFEDVAALQARVAELEGALVIARREGMEKAAVLLEQIAVKEINGEYQSRTPRCVVTLSDGISKIRAALEGGKKE